MPEAGKCKCGWELPSGLQYLTADGSHVAITLRRIVLIACGRCGRWSRVHLSDQGGWAPGMHPGETLPDGLQPEGFAERADP